jgi:hypothetical protein
MAGRTATKVSSVATSVSNALNDATDGVHTECLYSVVAATGDTTTVYNGPCIYYGATVTAALSAQVLLIQDNATVIDAFVASAAAGTQSRPACGIRCETSLVVNPDDAATGTLTVYYKPL